MSYKSSPSNSTNVLGPHVTINIKKPGMKSIQINGRGQQVFKNLEITRIEYKGELKNPQKYSS